MNKGEFVAGSYVQDMERGVLAGINPLPWQTDTSIGDWFYNKEWKTKDTGKCIARRTGGADAGDIVSKNGNLLLNVIQRPDGALDLEVEQLLAEVGVWMKANGEAIYGTRPWLIYAKCDQGGSGHFKEDFAFRAQDIRFTTKGKTLYAIALGWPADGQLLIKSLGKPTSEATTKSNAWNCSAQGQAGVHANARGLRVTLPAKKLSEIACSLRITGAKLQPAGTIGTGNGK